MKRAILIACAVMFSGCASRHARPPTAHLDCPHPGVIWSAPQEQTIGTMVRLVRERSCRICGFSQVRSEIKITKP